MHMHDQAAQPKRLSAAAAASESGIPKRTILYAIKAGHLKAELVDGLGYLIRRGDFDKYLSRRAERHEAAS